MRRKLFAMTMACLMLLGCTACTAEKKPRTGPFMFARRVLSHADLFHDSEGMPLVEQGEVLVFFTYMKTFDAEAAKKSTAAHIIWAIEAVTHEIALEGMGEPLRRQNNSEGEDIFTRQTDYSFGAAVSETWILPEAEYDAAYAALIADARNADAEEKTEWLMPAGTKGRLGQSIDNSRSFFVQADLAEQLKPGARAVVMSTELMRTHFPFLGSES